jgi:hypothetical protein
LAEDNPLLDVIKDNLFLCLPGLGQYK